MRRWSRRRGRQGSGRWSRLLTRQDRGLIPTDTVHTRALVAVIAIMSFLSALTIGAVALVHDATREWQAVVAREMTIQVKPVARHSLDEDVARAREIAAGMAGVEEVRVVSAQEIEHLLEPWLGVGLSQEDLPMPRLIILQLSRTIPLNVVQLRTALAQALPNASLDDHQGWTQRLKAMGDVMIFGGLGLLFLVILATVLSVVFATRAAMSVNRPTVEVLHFVGARDRYIAWQVSRHFMTVGLKGSLIGAVLALALYGVLHMLHYFGSATSGGQQAQILFGGFAMTTAGYTGMVLLVIIMAFIVSETSRSTVMRTLQAMR